MPCASRAWSLTSVRSAGAYGWTMENWIVCCRTQQAKPRLSNLLAACALRRPCEVWRTPIAMEPSDVTSGEGAVLGAQLLSVAGLADEERPQLRRQTVAGKQPVRSVSNDHVLRPVLGLDEVERTPECVTVINQLKVQRLSKRLPVREVEAEAVSRHGRRNGATRRCRQARLPAARRRAAGATSV